MGLFNFLSKPLKPSEDDPKFLEWYSNIAEISNLSPNPNDPRHYYDYKSAYKAGARLDKNKHLPSKFKHDLHPNRYTINKKTLAVHDTKYDVEATFEDLITQTMKRKEYEEDLFK